MVLQSNGGINNVFNWSFDVDCHFDCIYYLCIGALFKKETGMTFSEYVMRKKTETARNMIDYSGYSLSQIANILAFGSQSYFVKVFKKYEGITPGKYYSTHLPSATI